MIFLFLILIIKKSIFCIYVDQKNQKNNVLRQGIALENENVEAFWQ